MRISREQLAAALDGISEAIAKAENAFELFLNRGGEPDIEWNLELAYVQLMVLSETLDLPLLREEIAATLRKARQGNGLASTDSTPDGDPYLKWGGPARQFRMALMTVYMTESAQTITKDLEGILRGATYAITDRDAFGDPPSNEEHVHRRIEALLRCIFPDLLHKPKLTKQIENFEPDTGIPSIGTLIEYKFLSAAIHAPRIADEILADTRGYASKEWRFFLYVIYETERFKREAEWRQLLRECAVSENTSVVVLTGIPAVNAQKRTALTSRPKNKNNAGPPKGTGNK